jgi:Uncharacterized protein conserved in bacteria (DUF2330)
MKRTRLAQFVGAASLLITGSTIFTPHLVACGIAAQAEAPPVFVQAENAVIIWDSANQTEHFIREAKISTSSPDLGFLVPTPQTPEIAEADPHIFQMAAQVGGPVKQAPVVVQTPWQVVAPVAEGPTIQSVLEGGSASVFDLPSATLPPAKIPNQAVFSEHDVAGYHVTTLDPQNPQSIKDWLSQNGYASTSALQNWLQKYAAAGWKINAFRLIKTVPNDSSITTRAVRLSFPTAHPYYPYSEPADRQAAAAASPAGRVLHVAVLSDERMTGAKSDASNWPGKLIYAGSSVPPTGPHDPKSWLHLANLDDANHSVSPMTELTTFVDESNPRQGTADLYFSTSSSQSPFHATVIDRSLPTVHQMDWSNPVADAAALAAIILVPGVPLCFGWFLYSRNRIIRSDLVSKGLWPTTPTPTTLRQKIWRTIGIIWCLYYGGQLTYLAVVALFGRLGTSLAPGHSVAIWSPALLSGLTLAAVGAGITYCMQVWRSRSDATENELARKRRFQESLAIAALFVGGVGLALMMYVVFQMTI